MSAMGPRPASFTSQTSSMIEAEERGVMHVALTVQCVQLMYGLKLQ